MHTLWNNLSKNWGLTSCWNYAEQMWSKLYDWQSCWFWICQHWVHLQSLVLKVVVINGPVPSASSPVRSGTFNMWFPPAPCRAIIGPLSCGNQSVNGQSCSSSFVRKTKKYFGHWLKKCKRGGNGQQVHCTTHDRPMRVRDDRKL